MQKNENGFIEMEVKQLLDWEKKGPVGCIVSDKITKDGWCVGYMYREEVDGKYPDSGWRFLKGDESDSYMDNADNHHIFALNTVCNYDSDIIPYLDAPVGSKYIRISEHEFIIDEQDREIYFKKQER